MTTNPEDRASKIMAECIAENGGKNVAYYLARAIREDRRETLNEVAATIEDFRIVRIRDEDTVKKVLASHFRQCAEEQDIQPPQGSGGQ